MLLDTVMPTYDATRIERIVVAMPPDALFDAAMHADFLDAGRRSPVVRAAFSVREIFEKVVCFLRSRPQPVAAEPEHLRLTDMENRGEWVILAREPGREVVFGALGRFWSGETAWETIDAETFGTFDRPGYAKIACHLAITPHADGRSVVSYEARTVATDDASRRSFRRYWRVVSPFVGYIMRSMLRVIEHDAERDTAEAM
jgi:hypothetical protein